MKTKTKTFAVGDKVRLTGAFLRSTGQFAGGEGRSVWTVVGFWSEGSMVNVNEPVANPEMYADVPEADRPKWRSIAAWNLVKVGTPDHS